MPRPPKYTDDNISETIEALIAEGKEINPSRVRQRLGGGNIQRIKAIIDERVADSIGATVDTLGLPIFVEAEIQQLNAQNLRETQRLAAKLWQVARDEVSKREEEKAALSLNRISVLEEQLSVTNASKRQLEQVVSDDRYRLEELTKERDELSKKCEKLTAALRNAESDLRASDRVISVLERG